MIRKLRAMAMLGAGIGLALGLGLTALAAPAMATDNGTVTPVNQCLNKNEIKKWYGHDDEAALFANVSSTALGLRFNGASLVHREFPATKLKDLPKHALVTTVETAETTGRVPDFKIRTDAPFSTLTRNADGKWWSSKILPGEDGGQDKPLPGPANFVGLVLSKVAVPEGGEPVKYTEDTVSADIQLGYASDTGNVATVKSLVYAGKTYAFACPKIVASPGPSNGPITGSPKPTATKGPTKSASPAPELALTGEGGGTNWPAVIGGVGGLILVAGAAAVYFTRRRTFEA